MARFALVLKAIEPEKPAAKDDNRQGGDNGPGKGPPGQQGGIQSLAEIKLLKLMQEDLNQRTERLQAELAGREPTEPQRGEFDHLSEEQGRLVELILQLIKPAKEVEP